MGWWEAALLGLIQGLTEFLPISSSAHLRIASDLLNGHDVGAAFTAIVQIGTEAAVVVYFWRDIVRIVSHWARSLAGRLPADDPDARMGWLIIVGSLPIGVLGLLFQDQIEGALRNLWFVGTTLIVFGLLLAFADAVGAKRRELSQLTWRHGLLFGCFQALALIPGVSRSGGTITGGLLLGYTREAAARYSFLLAIPAVLASGLFELVKVVKDPAGLAAAGVGQTVLAAVVAFGVGYAVIAWFLKYVSTHDYRAFVYYRIALGLGVFALLLTGAVPALD